MVYGVVTSQWVVSSKTGGNVPELFELFGDRVTIVDVTGESIETVNNDPNFVNNGVWAKNETWQEIDSNPKTLVQYYG